MRRHCESSEKSYARNKDLRRGDILFGVGGAYIGHGKKGARVCCLASLMSIMYTTLLQRLVHQELRAKGLRHTTAQVRTHTAFHRVNPRTVKQHIKGRPPKQGLAGKNSIIITATSHIRKRSDGQLTFSSNWVPLVLQVGYAARAGKTTRTRGKRGKTGK